ncbi:16S rRNA (guanine(527)-N(7))-methyltransferase RsmG [Candidatus Ichthyocystis hellenicum]|uniref:16S rRNA (guanine(527)-N(7))-methyltransferase RsmG n=1 Tax=Candidatus Ichthyocystis hellenicum TaxID=1561003 RepID=UPI000AC43CAC|nr:16S rRNA (guanine(527)-N(7))-methyltransferase RsmG [Candidatus Ichthyocystis hellenicum]
MGSKTEFISESLSRQGILATEKQVSQLHEYVNLILEWNKVYNLTAVRSFDEIVVRHIVDSLSILPYLPNGSYSLLDVGSGAGLPGVPLSIMRPSVNCCLLDVQERRCVFLAQVIAELGLHNVKVQQSRLDSFQSNDSYGVIISRAFSSLAEFVSSSRHLFSNGDSWYAMKGRYPEDEVSLLPSEFVVLNNWQIKLIGSQACRCLLRIGYRGKNYE